MGKSTANPRPGKPQTTTFSRVATLIDWIHSRNLEKLNVEASFMLQVEQQKREVEIPKFPVTKRVEQQIDQKALTPEDDGGSSCCDKSVSELGNINDEDKKCSETVFAEREAADYGFSEDECYQIPSKREPLQARLFSLHPKRSIASFVCSSTQALQEEEFVHQ
jgi:hypothetical protein